MLSEVGKPLWTKETNKDASTWVFLNWIPIFTTNISTTKSVSKLKRKK